MKTKLDQAVELILKNPEVTAKEVGQRTKAKNPYQLYKSARQYIKENGLQSVMQPKAKDMLPAKRESLVSDLKSDTFFEGDYLIIRVPKKQLGSHLLSALLI